METTTTPDATTTPSFLTPQQVAAALGLSRVTIYRLIDHGLIPATKFGTKVRIPADFIRQSYADAWANQTAGVPVEEPATVPSRT